MIRVRALHAGAGDFMLRYVSLDVDEGEYAVVLGAAGAGKTTLLEAIAGIRRATGGTIAIGGRDITWHPPETRGVAMVYQHDYLFPHLDAGANVAYGARSPDDARVAAEMTGTTHLLARDVRSLSGGERQLVALARALATRAGVLLLDEPFGALDPPRRASMRRTLRDIQRREKLTVVHVTHDVAEAALLADRIALLDEGALLQTGLAPDVFAHPVSARAAELLGAENVFAGTVVARGDGLVEFRTGSLILHALADESPAEPTHAVVHAGEIVIAREAARSSARNAVVARVSSVTSNGALARIEMEASGTPLVASITASSARELALREGDEIHASWKATAVRLC
ncbi:MAG TPA: ATP-binding cassette domain-containing protein [Gemmatimonadaceae bacterium]|nr:ATP-binding cassette domain-containing protein [Gemmatimonadaceae bacterium]